MTDTDYRTGPPPPVDAVDTVNPKFIQCRVGVHGHCWRLIKTTRECHIIVMKSKCSNCGTVRLKKMTTGGGLVGRPDYSYPDGYLTKKGKNIRQPNNDGWRSRFISDTLGSLG